MAEVELDGVTKRFDEGEGAALADVSFAVEKGELLVVVGPSGCGKSTTLRIVAGLEEADGGVVRIGGRAMASVPPQDRDVAMVFQGYALYPQMTVRENIEFSLLMRKVDKAERRRRSDEAARMLKLDRLMDRLPAELSGGERQRVAMGRAIVRRPRVFLFDEPLSNLDAALRQELRVEIGVLVRELGATALYVTHDQVEAMTLADTLWVLNGGLVEQRGPPLEVYERPRTKFVATFLGSPQMNMVEGTLVKDAGRFYAEGGGIRALVDEDRFGAALEEGRAVSIGVRPHDLVVAKGDAPSVAELKIELVEALGFEAFAHGWIRQSGPNLIARLEPEEAKSIRAGATVRLAADASRVHLFDPKTGIACDAR